MDHRRYHPRGWRLEAMKLERRIANDHPKCRCAQHGEDNPGSEQVIGPRSVRYALQQAGLRGGRAVLVTELHSTQRAHRARARWPVQSGQEHGLGSAEQSLRCFQVLLASLRDLDRHGALAWFSGARSKANWNRPSQLKSLARRTLKRSTQLFEQRWVRRE